MSNKKIPKIMKPAKKGKIPLKVIRKAVKKAHDNNKNDIKNIKKIIIEIDVSELSTDSISGVQLHPIHEIVDTLNTASKILRTCGYTDIPKTDISLFNDVRTKIGSIKFSK